MSASLSPRSAQVIDLETVRQRHQAQQQLVRLAPELDGLEMLYQLEANTDTCYGIPILAWGLNQDGSVVGLVPWLATLTPCQHINSQENGRFVGYRDPETEEIFTAPPEHKYDELLAAANYFEYEASSGVTLIQQLPDTQGTHALCMDTPDAPWQMKPVYGWSLYSDGSIDALLVDENQVTMTPVLLGDDCLYNARTHHPRLYFFQRHIANRILEEDPATLEALALMVVPSSQSPEQG
ncbi:MAG: hypothetical protein L0J54_00750 [Halomonas sp.]|nr:hypothetical protein [Halomonas sp.]MDN6296537.1 hypothetical protein [Halomonas sp.]MDN6313890.1 hypothetical protein [Halomonas sp.]MDN6336910.1 hypothetical protein [Halomonas sp.]